MRHAHDNLEDASHQYATPSAHLQLPGERARKRRRDPGTGTSSSPLPYLFIVTDGSQDYQTQSSGGWSSQNWSSTGAVPYQNSATVIPPNSVTSTDYCTTLKNRGITIAILYIPYQTIINANASFASTMNR